jgi:antitoxin (DNA-binding transcriptional repressor) of toxin-antitoxin stability system
MKTITVTEAARNFSELVSRIHYRSESTLLVKGGRPMVRIIPANQAKTGRELAETWPGIPHLSAKEAAYFDHDLKISRRRLPIAKSKWE